MSQVISKDILAFFKQLQKNNNREWFTENKPKFKELEAKAKDFYIALQQEMQKHDDIDAFKLFRIYRDVRFSKNKTPYKTHFGGSYHRKKPHLRGGYYLQIAPNDSFIGVGFWNPNKDNLFRIRKEFEQDDVEIREILESKEFKNVWGGFVGDEVKTAPKGFSKEHKAIDLIRRKQFMFIKKFTDAEVIAPNFLQQVNSDFKVVRPFFDLMSDILTTNLNGESIL